MNVTELVGVLDHSIEELFCDYVVSPLNQRHKYCRVTVLRPIIVQIRFGYAPGARARPTSVDLDTLSGDFIQRLAHWRPSDRRSRVGEGLSHQCNSFSQQKNLHL